MKKIIKFIPLIFAPLVLSSCSMVSDALSNLAGGLGNILNGNTNNSSDNSSNSQQGGSSSQGGNSSQGSSSSSSSQGSSSSSTTGGSVTISQTSASVSVGSTTTLSATASDGSKITWSSNKTSVATVNNGVVTGVGVGSATITASATISGKSYSKTCAVTVTSSSGKAAWTILVYMCGADLESKSGSAGGYASKDIEEIRATVNQPSNVNIVFETGGAKSWKSGIIQGSGVKQVTAGELGRYHISGNNFIKDGKVSNANMGLASTLQSFLTWGFQTYPADKYGLILWNHGGAMDGVCFDENFSNDSLTTDEVASATTNARNTCGISDKLEFITYDACLMAVQDIAEANSSNFKYMLSSQETEVGDGYDYDAWLPTLYSNPTTVTTPTILEKIADTFIDENGGEDYYGDQTQSVYDLSVMNSYKTAFDNFSSGLASIVNNQDKWDAFAKICTNGSVQTYGEEQYDIYNLAGTKGLLKVMEGDSTYDSISTQINALDTMVSQLVIHEIHQKGIYGCGVCIAVPADGWLVQSTYNQQTNFRTWYSLCNKYGTWYSSWY